MSERKTITTFDQAMISFEWVQNLSEQEKAFLKELKKMCSATGNKVMLDLAIGAQTPFTLAYQDNGNGNTAKAQEAMGAKIKSVADGTATKDEIAILRAAVSPVTSWKMLLDQAIEQAAAAKAKAEKPKATNGKRNGKETPVPVVEVAAVEAQTFPLLERLAELAEVTV